ncbi:hypothetical protein DOY81_008330 [Sarcophaga bullata]|nr:hypothetical protein DOY81_008330 [Sarcophaga bullata]
MSARSSFNFRNAGKSDIKIVNQMIQELADLHDGVAEPKLTEQDFIRDSGLDGNHAICHIYVLEQIEENQSTIIGYAICHFNYSSWVGRTYYLEDIYVRPRYRGTGAGARIFCEVAAKADEFNCKFVDFHVLAHNTASIFYKKLGAVNMTDTKDRHYYRLKYNEIKKLVKQLKQ